MTEAAAKKNKPKAASLAVNVFDGGQPRIRVVDNSSGNVQEIAAKRAEAFKAAKVEIARAAHNIGASFYAMGAALKQVRDQELWKEGKCGGWREFAESISGVTYATVCNLIAVVENLTPELARQLGPTIAYAVARAPGEECKQELVDMASQGATVKQINQAAKRQRVKAGTAKPRKPKPASETKPGPKSVSKTKTKKGPSKKIRRDLESTDSPEEHDAKVDVVGQGEVTLKKGRGTFEIDGVTIEVKVVKNKLEYVARLN